MIGTARTHHRSRRRLRKRLEAQGIPAAAIARRVATRTAQHAERRQVAS